MVISLYPPVQTNLRKVASSSVRMQQSKSTGGTQHNMVGIQRITLECLLVPIHVAFMVMIADTTKVGRSW